MSSALPSSCFFQPWISVGWTPCWLASSFTVLSPFRAASATCALHAAVCLCLFFAAILASLPGLPLSSLVGCPVFGVHYTLGQRSLSNLQISTPGLTQFPPACTSSTWTDRPGTSD